MTSDCVITQVGYDEDGKRITQLKIWDRILTGLTNERVVSHKYVADNIKARRKSYETYGTGGSAAKVHVYSSNGNDYLRTDQNEIEEDNLGNLPRITD